MVSAAVPLDGGPRAGELDAAGEPNPLRVDVVVLMGAIRVKIKRLGRG